MKKITGLMFILVFLSGCVESVALIGPISGSGNVAQSALSSSISYGVKKQTGKSPMEHAIAYAEKHNPEKKKSKCVSFIEGTNSEICEAVKKNILETKEYFVNKQKIIKRSLIEDLAKKSDIYKRR
jgi:hypothetical protein